MSAPLIEVYSPYAIPGKEPVTVRFSEDHGWRVTMGEWLDESYEDRDSAIQAGQRQSKVEYAELHIYL